MNGWNVRPLVCTPSPAPDPSPSGSRAAERFREAILANPIDADDLGSFITSPLKEKT